MLAQSLASITFQVMGRRAEGEQPLPSHKFTDWAPQQDVLGLDLDTEKMTISMPAKKIRELQELLNE